MHAAIYRLRSDVSFIIHTHQRLASAASVLPLDRLVFEKTSGQGTGEFVSLAAYGESGTVDLIRHVCNAIQPKIREENSIIMRNHGAIFFGKSADDAFNASSSLEYRLATWFAHHAKGRGWSPTAWIGDPDEESLTFLDPEYLASFLSFMVEKYGALNREAVPAAINRLGRSVRNGSAVMLLDDHARTHEHLHRSIYEKNPNIGAIRHAYGESILQFSRLVIDLPPMLDDFAQIIGVKMASIQTDSVLGGNNARFDDNSGVFLHGNGALIFGNDSEDARAAERIVDKNTIAWFIALLFGAGNQLPFECAKQNRDMYLADYSKRGKLL